MVEVMDRDPKLEVEAIDESRHLLEDLQHEEEGAQRVKESLALLFRVLGLSCADVVALYDGGARPLEMAVLGAFETKEESRGEYAGGEEREAYECLGALDLSTGIRLKISSRIEILMQYVEGELLVRHDFASLGLSLEACRALEEQLQLLLRRDVASLLYDGNLERFALVFAAEVEQIDPFFLAIWMPLFVESIRFCRERLELGRKEITQAAPRHRVRNEALEEPKEKKLRIGLQTIAREEEDLPPPAARWS